MRNLLKDKKGETLIETLAAILVFTMASIVLYSMVTTASNINRQARDKDVLIEQQMRVAEQQKPESGNHVEGAVVMTMNVKQGSSTVEKEISKFDVNIFRDPKEESLYSYSKS